MLRDVSYEDISFHAIVSVLGYESLDRVRFWELAGDRPVEFAVSTFDAFVAKAAALVLANYPVFLPDELDSETSFTARLREAAVAIQASWIRSTALM